MYVVCSMFRNIAWITCWEIVEQKFQSWLSLQRVSSNYKCHSSYWQQRKVMYMGNHVEEVFLDHDSNGLTEPCNPCCSIFLLQEYLQYFLLNDIFYFFSLQNSHFSKPNLKWILLPTSAPHFLYNVRELVLHLSIKPSYQRVPVFCLLVRQGVLPWCSR